MIFSRAMQTAMRMGMCQASPLHSHPSTLATCHRNTNMILDAYRCVICKICKHLPCRPDLL